MNVRTRLLHKQDDVIFEQDEVRISNSPIGMSQFGWDPNQASFFIKLQRD